MLVMRIFCESGDTICDNKLRSSSGFKLSNARKNLEYAAEVGNTDISNVNRHKMSSEKNN
jgi:hypothetical protein